MEKHVLAALLHASANNNNTRKKAEQTLLKAFNHNADVSMQCLARVCSSHVYCFLRLMANLSGDHMVLGIFAELIPLIVPCVFLGLGIFVSVVQAFVFTLLSTVYFGLAVAHPEEDH